MKPWLAIDTATDMASVAAGLPPDARAHTQVRGARRHAAELVAAIEVTLERLGIAARDLEGVVVGDGPGSFTGLRIGWATAKGLVQETGGKLWTVPSLLAAAAGGGAGLGARPVAAWFDALRGEIFGALYSVGPNQVETLIAPGVFVPEAFVAQAPARAALVVGDGAVRYEAIARQWSGALPVSPEDLPPLAVVELSLLGRDGAARSIDDPLMAEPSYGRPAGAQARWEAAHGRPLPDPSRPSH